MIHSGNQIASLLLIKSRNLKNSRYEIKKKTAHP